MHLSLSSIIDIQPPDYVYALTTLPTPAGAGHQRTELQPVKGVGIVHWWPATAGVGRVS
jgi:hypothetical protein